MVYWFSILLFIWASFWNFSKIKMFVTVFWVIWSLVPVYTKWPWPNAVNKNTLQLTQELFQVRRKRHFNWTITYPESGWPRTPLASCEFSTLPIHNWLCSFAITNVFEFFFAMKRFIWFVFLGDCNFQKMPLNILLPYLNYLLTKFK